jgi:hypothetical protein
MVQQLPPVDNYVGPAIKPESIIDGIVSITTPIYIRIAAESAWFNMFRNSAKALTGNILAEPLMRLINFTRHRPSAASTSISFHASAQHLSVNTHAVRCLYRLPTLKIHRLRADHPPESVFFHGGCIL